MEEDDEAELAVWTSSNFVNVFQVLHALKNKIMDYDP